MSLLIVDNVWDFFNYEKQEDSVKGQCLNSFVS